MLGKSDGGEAILEALRALGVDHIFSSPGSEWAPIWEALARQKASNRPGPDFIESWHESLAVAMAIGYTRITRRTQAVILHAGVGLLQGAMAIGAALYTETPMVVMSGESVSAGTDPAMPIEPQWYNSLNAAGGIARQIDPLVKRASQVTHTNMVFDSVTRAGELASRSPMGPVYLDLPIEVMLGDWMAPETARRVPPASRQVAAPDEVAVIAAELSSARLPVIVTELAGQDPEAYAALIGLAEALGAPVINGRATAFGNFPKDHALYLGVVDYRPVAESDLVLLVGCRAPWYPPDKRPTEGRIVSIDDNPIKREMAYQVLHADAYLEGNVATSLRELTRLTHPEPAQVVERGQRWRGEHDALVAGLRAQEEAARTKEAIETRALCAALNETAPAGTIYVEEAVTNAVILLQHLAWSQPQSFIKSTTGLGQGLGMALGVKLAARQRPVVLLLGDGAFLYNPVIPALGAARAHGLPILIVVLNNRRYAAMKQGHLFHYPDGASQQTGQWYGVAIDGPDYETFGREFGFLCRKVERTAELVPALTEAFAALAEGRGAILNVILS